MRAFSFHPVPDRSRRAPGATCGPIGRLRVLSALLPLFLVLALPPSAKAQFPAEVQGRVLDAVQGTPVSGARIAVWEGSQAVHSEGDGAFRLRGLDEGGVRLVVSAPGYETGTFEVSVRNGAVTRAELSLAPRVVALEALDVAVDRSQGFRLDREAVRRSGAGTLGELLEGVPGVVVRRQGPGGVEQVSLRGAGGDQVLVLVDGVPLNDPLTGTADLSAVPVAGVTDVEVLPGARGARHGPGALGGVVRIRTGVGASGPEAALGVGSLGERSALVAAAEPLGDLVVEGGARMRRLDGGFDFDRGESLGGGWDHRRNADLLQGALHLAVARETPGDEAPGGWRLRGSLDQVERGIPGKAYAPSDSARQRQSRAAFQGRWGGEILGVALEAAGHHLRQEVRFRDPDPPLGLPFDHRSLLRSTGVDAEVPARPVGGWDGPSGLHLGGGVSLRHQRIVSDQLDGDGTVERMDGALFLHGEVAPLPLPGEPALSGAFRVHRDGVDGGWLTAHDVTVRLPAGPWSFRAAHRSSFSPPSAGDQFFREGVGVRPNPDLRAERVPSEVEVGVGLRFAVREWSGRLEGEAFRGDIRDMIIWSPDFRFVWSPRNADVRRRGVELRARVRHGPSSLRLGGHLSRTEVTYVRSGSAPPAQVIYRPRDTGSLLLGWDPSPYRLEVRARYTGARYPVAAPVNALEPFWTLDAVLSGAWRLGGWHVRPLVRVDRLLDERNPFIHAFPEPGRTVHVEVRVAPNRPLWNRP